MSRYWLTGSKAIFRCQSWICYIRIIIREDEKCSKISSICFYKIRIGYYFKLLSCTCIFTDSNQLHCILSSLFASNITHFTNSYPPINSETGYTVSITHFNNSYPPLNCKPGNTVSITYFINSYPPLCCEPGYTV